MAFKKKILITPDIKIKVNEEALTRSDKTFIIADALCDKMHEKGGFFSLILESVLMYVSRQTDTDFEEVADRFNDFITLLRKNTLQAQQKTNKKYFVRIQPDLTVKN